MKRRLTITLDVDARDTAYNVDAQVLALRILNGKEQAFDFVRAGWAEDATTTQNMAPTGDDHPGDKPDGFPGGDPPF